jgi:alpha-1,2-mannosyltransferase
MATQAVSSILMAIVVWWTWRRELDTTTKAAVLAAATPLATSYILDYDLVLLVLPIALVARHRPRLALALSIVPLFSRDLSVATGIGVGPLMFVVLLWAVLRPPVPGVGPPLDRNQREAKVSAQS